MSRIRVIRGEYAGCIGELVSEEKTAYGPILFVWLGNDTVGRFTEKEIEHLKDETECADR